MAQTVIKSQSSVSVEVLNRSNENPDGADGTDGSVPDMPLDTDTTLPDAHTPHSQPAASRQRTSTAGTPYASLQPLSNGSSQSRQRPSTRASTSFVDNTSNDYIMNSVPWSGTPLPSSLSSGRQGAPGHYEEKEPSVASSMENTKSERWAGNNNENTAQRSSVDNILVDPIDPLNLRDLYFTLSMNRYMVQDEYRMECMLDSLYKNYECEESNDDERGHAKISVHGNNIGDEEETELDNFLSEDEKENSLRGKRHRTRSARDNDVMDLS
jgi:hypothetical protein